ncbi:YkvA family protein [Undibacterium rugosum]|uniref:DUF1232 domain-containing protein n=1 Tax=Undibacterium rugosum TaxID=2762291 RepID=A0A923KU68_9BURK|nr:YkvA family protein [Undibacterium rugosum]MBC3936784.1 DUF1232 domain-containing protein [Undibacterium rugosum]MBR7780113.1 DUF1232 domain-containing protein [Undibacterium rugosum]
MKAAESYSDAGFWAKLRAFASQAGREVVEKALCLYYAAQRPDTPLWAKTAIFGALAYFISPLDAIPDVLPGVGYTDDLGVLAAALVTVGHYIDNDVKQRAGEQLRKWFGGPDSLT